jgi:hypothetical protein
MPRERRTRRLCRIICRELRHISPDGALARRGVAIVAVVMLLASAGAAMPASSGNGEVTLEGPVNLQSVSKRAVPAT